ncbi:Zan, partial [Symbiodinium sp. CCMP2456]
IEVKGFVSRLVDVCDDPMAIKENLLLVIDSIMRHAEKEDVSAVRKFEKAFAPHLYTLFGACVKSSENRSQVATYLLKKLVPFWKENAWFSRE